MTDQLLKLHNNNTCVHYRKPKANLAWRSLLTQIQKCSNSDKDILDIFWNLLYTRNLEIRPTYQNILIYCKLLKWTAMQKKQNKIGIRIRRFQGKQNLLFFIQFYFKIYLKIHNNDARTITTIYWIYLGTRHCARQFWKSTFKVVSLCPFHR